MKTILFLGDSITDAGRDRSNDCYMGYGYVTLTAGKIGCDYPGQFKVLNRGISGDRSVDLYARIKKDIINLKPNFMSILIGINDAWAEFDYGNGVSAEKYEMILDMLIKEIKDALPNTKIILMEPFMQLGKGTETYFGEFACEAKRIAEAAARIANKYGLPFVLLQNVLDDFANRTSSETVLIDGVHPTCVGHELISRELYRAYQNIL